MTNTFAASLKAEAENNSATNVKAAASGRSDMFYINPYVLAVKPGWNSRDLTAAENMDHITGLARSIADCGVQEPLTVFTEDGAIYLSDGHCRLAATKYAIEKLGAEIKAIPVKVEPRGSSEADRLASQLVRNSGKGLTDLEKAVVFLRLRRMGWDDTAIARRAGLASASAVARIVELNELPEQMKALINEGTVSVSLARDAVRKAGDAKVATEKLVKVKEAKAKEAEAAPPKERKVKGAKPGDNVLAAPPKVRVTAKDVGPDGATQRSKVARMVKEVLDQSNYTLSMNIVTVKVPLAKWNKLCATVGHESEV